jgi:hypothetical protein
VASVGATRVRKFVKYLEHDGWHATVITGAMRRRPTRSHDARRASDFESLADIPPSTAVHRLSPVVDAWPAFAARYAAARLAAITQFVGCHESYWTAKLRWRFDRIHNALAFPDRGVFRLPQAVALACRLHRARPFDAMLSSGMPFSDHLIALVLQNHLRLPWLADFRDPWVEYIHWKQWRSTPGLKLTRAAERVVVRRASFVISVNDHMTERFGLRYRRVPATKFVTLPNGFDPADFPEHRREQPSSRFHLLYAGSLYATRSPANLLDAFRRFIDATPGAAAHVRLDFAGRAGPSFDELIRPGDGETIGRLGLLTHREALARMVQADANVILLPNLPGSENDTTAKVYECLGSRRAILAAVPLDGAAARELRPYPGVWRRDPDDIEGLSAALGEMYAAWLAGRLDGDRSAESLAPLTRHVQTRKLADLLDAAIRARHLVERCR